MNYNKIPKTLEDQITLLKGRGLKINSDKEASSFLKNISYYRFSAYLLTFQRFGDTNHNYMPWASLNRVIELYAFDRQLRLICLDAIERIEVAVRCRISHEYSIRHGNNWYEDESLYINKTDFEKTCKKIKDELGNTKEIFIQHYRSKYTIPKNPPSCMTIEILSFGQLSRMFKTLKSNDAKKEVAKHFGVSSTILESWLENLSYIRNICAHHSRLWNRTLTKKPMLPTRVLPYEWINHASLKPDKIYNSLCVMAYLQDRIKEKPPFFGLLNTLFSRCPHVSLKMMGFPDNWRKDKFWNKRYTPMTHKARAIIFKSINLFISSK